SGRCAKRQALEHRGPATAAGPGAFRQVHVCRALPCGAASMRARRTGAGNAHARPHAALHRPGGGTRVTLLSVRGSEVTFHTRRGPLRAVAGVDLEVERAESVALVGESGCGKSTLARGIAGLEPLSAGSVILEGQVRAKRAEPRQLSRTLQMVFQDPDASLNPRMTLQQAIAEPLRIHRIVPRAEEEAKVCEILAKVGIDPALRNRYPHELSGGQKQRTCIARALAVEPALLILD